MVLSQKTIEKIDELFNICSNSTGMGTADFKNIATHFWMCLQNDFTLVRERKLVAAMMID